MADAFGGKYNEVMHWVMSLPEVEFTVKEGRITADDALITTIRSDEERFVDTLDGDGLEFSEMGSVDSSPEELEDVELEDDDNEEAEDGAQGISPPAESLLGAWEFR